MASSSSYSSLCEKCLHPLERHAYVVAKTDGKEVRRCEIGVCHCIRVTPIKPE